MPRFELSSHDVSCPYCGESINVDHSVDSQSYVEDCQVCCQPIVISVTIDDETESPNISCDVENL